MILCLLYIFVYIIALAENVRYMEKCEYISKLAKKNYKSKYDNEKAKINTYGTVEELYNHPMNGKSAALQQIRRKS